MSMNPIVSPVHSARNPLPDNPIDDPQPNFDAPRLIQRADALCYSLPMLAPDGSRCHVVLVGSFAAWSETMTALVRAGFVADCEVVA